LVAPENRVPLQSGAPAPVKLTRVFHVRGSAFVLPVGSRAGLEPDQLASGRGRRRHGVVVNDPLGLYRARQGDEERHILFAAEKHDLLRRAGREQREVGKSIPLSTAYKIVGLRAERDVIGGRKKSRFDQAPPGGKNVRFPYAELLHQGAIGIVFIQFECGQQPERIVPGTRIVGNELIPPCPSCVGCIVRAGTNTIGWRRRQSRSRSLSRQRARGGRCHCRSER
jgi:hypothetical protein